MDYVACTFKFEEVIPWREILMVSLCELPFESFEEEGNTLKAYIPNNVFAEEEIQNILSDFQYQNIHFEHNLIKDQNWNSEWEKNFKEIIINDNCIVRAPFHEPNKKYEYDILINPQMSFGTGHHQTTSLILNYMTGQKYEGLKVLDMGCGTGVLAIFAEKLGATDIKAIDIDKWSYENTLENIQLNDCKNIEVFEGDASLLYENEKFDVILANINRNILLNDFSTYNKSLNEGGKIIMSGFYTTDIESIEKKANELGIVKLNGYSKEDWAMVEFVKK